MRETVDIEMGPPLYEDQFWDPEQEAGFWEAEPAERQFAQGGDWDDRPADPVLAMSVVRTAEGELSGLSDNELLGAIGAGERVLGQAAWAANRLAAEYTRRNLEVDDKTGEETLGEFGADDYAQEVKLSGMAAKGNLRRALTLSQLPECMKLAHAGALNEYRQRIIAEETGSLDPVLLAKADELIAKDASGRTPGSLRGYARKIVMMLDPQQAEERRKDGSKNRRVEFWPESSGNITMAAREMSVAVAAAIKQGLTGWAQIMRKAGIKGSMDNLRHDAAAALLMGRHPLTGQVPSPPPDPEAGTPAADPFNPWGFGDFEIGTEADAPPVPGSPRISINLLVTPGTLDPRIDAPGYIPEFGANITGKVARDLITAGTTNPATRWCLTQVDPVTGFAVGHGCARGQHPWTPPGTGPPGGGPFGAGPSGAGPDGGDPSGAGPPGKWPYGPAARPGEEVREFIASLGVRMERLATDPGEDGWTESQHDPSRKLRHLVEARNATCATPGCDHPAVTSDMEHRIEWEKGGKTSEGNLDPGKRHCHRLKQRDDWAVRKTGPRETIWTGPSGRRRTVHPTRYLV
jgi:hypothetical protein